MHGWEEWGEACVKRFRGHVRVRALGPQPRNAVPRARPPRREAAVLRAARRRLLGLRLGAEGAARPSRGCRARSIRSRSRNTSPTATCPSRARSSRACSSSGRAARWRCSAGQPAPRAGASTGTCRSSRGRRPTEEEAREELVRRLRESVQAAHDLGRSARRLSFRRRGFERGRGDDGGLSRGSGGDLLDLVRRSRRSTNRPTRRRWRTATGRATTSSRWTRTISAWWTGSRRCTTSPTPTARRYPPTACASWRARA